MHVNDTVTGVLPHPLRFGIGEAVAIMPGFGFSANLVTNPPWVL